MNEPIASPDQLRAPIANGESKQFGGLSVDIGKAGSGRIQRIVYPSGWRWSTDVQPLVNTDWCRHGHVGFLASGHLAGKYADTQTFVFEAPTFVTIDPGHDLWVEGAGDAVLIQFDFERATVARLELNPRS